MVSLASWLHWVPKKSHQRLSVLGADFQRCFPSQKNHSRQVRRMIEGDTCHDSFSWSGQFQDRIFPFFFPFMYVGGMPKPWFYWEFMESTVNQWVFGHKMYEWLIFEVHFHVRLRGWGLPILRVFFVPSSLKGYPFIINIYIYTKYHHHCIDTGNFPFATSTNSPRAKWLKIRPWAVLPFVKRPKSFLRLRFSANLR